MILGAVIARGWARRLVDSTSEGAPHRWCWLPLTVVCAVSACTLTESSFEPSSVSRVDNGLTPDESGSMSLPPPSDADEGSTGAPDTTNSEGQGLDGTPLDPSQPNPPDPDSDRDGESSGTGATPAPDGDDATDPEEVDGGAGSDDGTGSTAPPDTSDPTEQPEPEPDPCPGQTFGASCYELFAEAATWAAAEQRCVTWGGHLASVESFAENDFLGDWPAQLGIPVGDGSGIWLGGTDAALDGVFRWSDGTPVLIESWAPNQPDNGAGVDCIEKRNDGTGLWYDRRCMDALPFVCERPL